MFREEFRLLQGTLTIFFVCKCNKFNPISRTANPDNGTVSSGGILQKWHYRSTTQPSKCPIRLRFFRDGRCFRRALDQLRRSERPLGHTQHSHRIKSSILSQIIYFLWPVADGNEESMEWEMRRRLRKGEMCHPNGVGGKFVRTFFHFDFKDSSKERKKVLSGNGWW